MPSVLVACRLTQTGCWPIPESEVNAAAASNTTGIPCRASKSAHAAKSGGAPKALTTNTAATGPGTDFSAAVAISGVSARVSGSASSRYGVSPALHTACALAMKVNAGIRQ
ncbi:hypothetical protein D3C85_1190020 [compost metagenome]